MNTPDNQSITSTKRGGAPCARGRLPLLTAGVALACTLAMPMFASAEPVPTPDKDLSAQQAQKLEKERRAQLAADDAKAQRATNPGEEVPLDKSNLQNLKVTKSAAAKPNQAASDGVKLEMGSFVGLVRFVSADVVKVTLQAAGQPAYQSVAVVKNRINKVSIKRSKSRSTYTMKTKGVTVRISLSKFGVTMLDKKGNVINADDSRFGSGYEDGKPYVFKKTD